MHTYCMYACIHNVYVYVCMYHYLGMACRNGASTSITEYISLYTYESAYASILYACMYT